MKKVLIASRNVDEMARFKIRLEQTFEVYCIAAPDFPKEGLSMFDVVLVDYGFTENSGVDYIAEVLKRWPIE